MPSPTTFRPLFSPNRAHLMMRYYAPLGNFDPYLKWIVEICRQAEVGEVIFIIDPEEHYFGFPTLGYMRRWARTLKIAGDKLRAQGIIMSVNPWVTLSHSGRGYPSPKELGFTATMVGDDGKVSLDTACPADPAWQRYIAESYGIIAGANPEILWLEDDHRLHNHCIVRFGCFARPMLREFARRNGRLWEREDLVKAVVSGKGTAREGWLKFTGDLWNENAARIREAVHQVNPNVKLAQMTSSMAAHSAEGRRWSEFLPSLCGPHRPVTRPHFGPYRQATGFDFAPGLSLFRHGLAFAGRGTRFCPELDNGPHSYFSKGQVQTQLMLELGAFFGCRDVTFNFFALAGNDPHNEPWVIEQLRAARPRMDSLVALGLERRVESGVHLWTSERAALHQKTDGMPAIMDSLFPAFDAWSRVFTRIGIASTFETPGALTAVAGDTIRAADDAEIRRLLSGGLLIDGRAAMALQEMGYGKYLGVTVKRRQVSGEAYALPIEETLDEKFGLKGSPIMCCTQMGHHWGDCYVYVHDLKGARAISRFLAGNHKPIGPAVTLFENKLGGRVAVYPYDFDSGIPDSVRFFHHPRKCQLQAVVRWLNGGRATAANPDMAQIAVEWASVDGLNVLAVISLHNDPIGRFTVELPDVPPVKALSMLQESGKWKALRSASISQKKLTVSLAKPLESFQACFFKWGKYRVAPKSRSVQSKHKNEK